MKRFFCLLWVQVIFIFSAFSQEGSYEMPQTWRWLGDKEVAFSVDGTFQNDADFVLNTKTFKKRYEKIGIPVSMNSRTDNPASDGAKFDIPANLGLNVTLSPDSTKLAYTRDNDLYVRDLKTSKEYRLTSDGSDLILNGYASWVYYEEIFGRPSRYKAFWWSPDGSKLGFYRFDNANVPYFPIYSHEGQTGSLNNTRYPKAGQSNPKVKIGFVDVSLALNDEIKIIWADFDQEKDQYFGTPFWDAESKDLFISRMPRLQNTLTLYRVNSETGNKTEIYKEKYHTWIDWITGMKFTKEGIIMARRFETAWQQIYFLSYDGKEFKRLSDGPNWDINLVEVDKKTDDIYFLAKRTSSINQSFYKLDAKGRIWELAPRGYSVHRVSLSPNNKCFVAAFSNATTPTKLGLFSTKGTSLSINRVDGTDKVEPTKKGNVESFMNDEVQQYEVMDCKVRKYYVIADSRNTYPDYDKMALPKFIFLTNRDGFKLPAAVILPKNFDPTKKYPVHIDIYGGPNTPLVADVWGHRNMADQWWSNNGIIQVVADPGAAGHNGSAALDKLYKQLTVNEIEDFVEWAKYFQSLPYVDGDKIGVEGFSFGGTMTAMLLLRKSDYFHFGNAGGGVYDWSLYDSHYTERYMDTPANNPDGYKVSSVLEYVKEYPSECADLEVYNSDRGVCDEGGENDGLTADVMLKITHGTGDDNVHFQNTLKLIDALHKENKSFEFMIYPDGMHGYGGYQGLHFRNENRSFWVKSLLAN